MARYIDADALMEKQFSKLKEGEVLYRISPQAIIEASTADVAPRAEVFEAVDKFRADLMHRLIDLCGGNDYKKLTLLKIDEVVCKIYDTQIAELKKKYTGES